MLRYIESVGIQVSDQDRALDFYVNKLGFEKINDEPMGEGARWIVVAPPGSRTGLILSKRIAAQHSGGFNSLAQGESAAEAVGGFTSYVFYTDDMEGAYKTLKGRGVHFSKQNCLTAFLRVFLRNNRKLSY
jgi:catechol 2,3-dioxygenase-like lactoylglutathione lyase family enzyme